MGQSLDIDTKQANAFGVGFTNFGHNFLETGLFADSRLARLIENYPAEYLMLTTMNRGGGEYPEWRNGELNGLNGKAVLNAVKKGKIWLCLRRFDVAATAYHEVVEQAMTSLKKSNPNLRTSKHSSSLLISSPGARVFYHADIPMIALWHLRGRKRVWLYDPENRTQLPDDVLEGVFLRETEEEIPYDAAWDADATAIDLEPGMAISWPLNAPHRVDNLEGLNVSITTEYMTPDAQLKYGVYVANGFLRRYLGWKPLSTKIRTPAALVKCALALAVKKSGLLAKRERKMISSFRLDPAKPGGIIDLPLEQQQVLVQSYAPRAPLVP